MEELIAKWIREAVFEFERAKSAQNLHRMFEMRRLVNALRVMRDKLLSTGN